jgi:hypothetical protein
MDEKTIYSNNILDVVDQIFSQKPPPPPCSVVLEINGGTEHEVNKEGSKNTGTLPHDQHAIFRTLGVFLTHGIQKLLNEKEIEFNDDGEPIPMDITSLTPLDIETLQQYLNAVGWTAIIKDHNGVFLLGKEHTLKSPNVLPFILNIPIHTKQKDKQYISIWFEPYRPPL